MDRAGPSRVTPSPPPRPGALKKPMGSTEKGAMAPVTPPKAGSPATSPARASSTAATAGTGVIPKPTPKSPPPIGLSPASSPTTPPPSVRGKSSSPGKGGESTEGSEGRKKKRSRTPLRRRPPGKKQRAQFAKGNYGDQRVKFANPIDNRGQGGDNERKGGKDKGKQPGKGKGKSKGKSKGKPKGKGKDKPKKDDSKQMGSRAPGGGDGREKKD